MKGSIKEGAIMRTLLACFVAIGFIAPAAAQTVVVPEGTILEEYVLSDEGRIRCGIHPDTAAAMPDLDVLEVLTRRCLRMGELFMHMPRSDAEKVLPPATKEIADPNFPVLWVSYLNPSGADGGYVVGYNNDFVVYIWAQGPVLDSGEHFSSIRIDAPAETIVARLGEPTDRVPNANGDGEQWIYGVESFTFEIVNGRVYSIQLRSPKWQYLE